MGIEENGEEKRGIVFIKNGCGEVWGGWEMKGGCQKVLSVFFFFFFFWFFETGFLSITLAVLELTL